MKKNEKYLGEMLIAKGLITEDQLQIMIQEQFRKKIFLGDLFIKKGLVTEFIPLPNSLILSLCNWRMRK